jgi:Kinesin motor domain
MNMCVFTYGQTNSGKTFTMKGPPNDNGLVLRSLEGLFTRLAPSLKCYFEITMSYFEIYNEEVYDLLDTTPNAEPLKVQYDKEKGVEIKGLTKKFVYSFSEAAKCYDSGENKRKFAVTNMNHNSSRSHVLLQIGIRTKFVAHPTRSYYAVLLMADLAGSESMGTAQTSGVTQREGSLINKSLLALTTIITRLKSSQKKSGPLSYRDSKLTRVLQPVLTENTNTMVICTVSRDNTYIHESMNTLRFGDCANKLKVRMRPVDVEKLSLSAREKREQTDDYQLDDEHSEHSSLDVANAELKNLRVENAELREVLEKTEIELEHQTSMYQLQEEKNTVLEESLKIKESEIRRLREDNRHMQRVMEIQEKNIVLSLEHSMKKRLIFEVRAAYESEIGRLKTELLEAIEASTLPMEDKTLKRKLKALHEKLAIGEKEIRDLKSKLSNKEEDIRRMKSEIEVLHDEKMSRITRVVPHISVSKKHPTPSNKESSAERKIVQNSLSREVSRNKHRNCLIVASLDSIPKVKIGTFDQETQDPQRERIFNDDGTLSRQLEKSIKKGGEVNTSLRMGSRSGHKFSFGGPISNSKPPICDFDIEEPSNLKIKTEEKLSSPDINKNSFFDNIARSPLRNANTTDYLDSFYWRGRASQSEPHQPGQLGFFASKLPESLALSTTVGNTTNSNTQTYNVIAPESQVISKSTVYLDASQAQASPRPRWEASSSSLSIQERIENLRRPLH